MQAQKITKQIINQAKNTLVEFGVSRILVDFVFYNKEFNTIREVDCLAKQMIKKKLEGTLNLSEYKEAYKMKDTEIKIFTKEDDMKDFFEVQGNNDKWIKVYTNEIECAPLPDCKLNALIPHAFQHVMKYTRKKGSIITDFASDVNEDDITSSMSTTKTSVCFPDGNGIVMYPLRYTAFQHVQERSGITGSSISSLRERKRAMEINPEVRCNCINEGLSLYRDKTLVLVRDGKVTALLSGDESDYAIMPVIQLVNIVEEELKNSYCGYTFAEARTSHEISSITYSIHDEEIENRILDILSSAGELVSKITIDLRLTTSDVGKCAARVTPIIYERGRELIIGKSQSVEHKGGAKAIAAFSDSVHLILGKFRENISCLERLMRISVNHPVEMLKNLYEALKLTGYSSALKEVQEKIVAEKSGNITAYDIYWYLNEMLFIQEEANRKAGKTISLFESIKAQETVAEILFISDLQQYDTDNI